MNPIFKSSRWSNERTRLPFQEASYDYVAYKTNRKGWSYIHWQFGPNRRVIKIYKYGQEDGTSLWTLIHLNRWIFNDWAIYE